MLEEPPVVGASVLVDLPVDAVVVLVVTAIVFVEPPVDPLVGPVV